MNKRPAEPAGRLLLVDDDPFFRELVGLKLRERGWHVEEAAGAQAALERAAGPIELLLMDIEMPEMDGIEAVRRLRASRDALERPVIMLTGRGEDAAVVEALAAGANDFVEKGADLSVLCARILTHLTLKRTADRARRLEAELTAKHQRLESGLAAAARVQRAFLPQQLPATDAVAFAWSFEPSEYLAGDMLGVLDLGSGCYGCYLLDVMGHGVAAALDSVSIARQLARVGEPDAIVTEVDDKGAARPVAPERVAGALNRRFQRENRSGRFFTLVYAVVCPALGRVEFVCAGHPGPLLVRPGQAPAQHQPAAFPIGVGEEAYVGMSLAVRPGDRLFFFTDGLLEVRAGGRGAMFGMEGLERALAGTGPLEEVLERTLETVRTHAGGPLDDDASLLALEIR